MTFRSGTWESAFIRLSEIPSLRYSSSGSEEELAKGRMAREPASRGAAGAGATSAAER